MNVIKELRVYLASEKRRLTALYAEMLRDDLNIHGIPALMIQQQMQMLVTIEIQLDWLEQQAA